MEDRCVGPFCSGHISLSLLFVSCKFTLVFSRSFLSAPQNKHGLRPTRRRLLVVVLWSEFSRNKMLSVARAGYRTSLLTEMCSASSESCWRDSCEAALCKDDNKHRWFARNASQRSVTSAALVCADFVFLR